MTPSTGQGEAASRLEPPLSEVSQAAVTASGRRVAGIADPSPLGLFAYGITLGVLSFIHLGFISAKATPFVVALSLPVGGLGMIIAGLWAFRRGTAFGGTALVGYGVFWVNYYLLFGIYGSSVPKAQLGDIAGIWLAFWGLFTLMLLLASFPIDAAHPFFLFWLVLTFGFLSAGQFAGSATLVKIGGITGLVSVCGAIYVAYAQLLEAQYRRKILPFCG